MSLSPRRSRSYEFSLPFPPWLFVLLLALFLLSCSREGKGSTGDEQAGGGPVGAAGEPGLVNPDRDRLLPPAERNREPDDGGIVTTVYAYEPHTLNNLVRRDQLAKSICSFICPPLLVLDRDTFDLVPFAAAALPEVSPDHLVHTWHLRRGLRWDDFEKSGACLTARDMAFSFKLMKDPSAGAQRTAVDFEHLKEVRVIDDYTFQAVYDAPEVDGVFKMGTEFRIVPRHVLENVPPGRIASHAMGRAPLGYGPFRFVHWKHGREILLRRREANLESYPPRFRPHVEGLRFTFVADTATLFPLFLREEIDICSLSPDDWYFKTRTPAFEKIATRHVYYLPTYFYIAWNNESPLFNDARVRRAMTHLVRRKEILETHMHGLGKIITGPFFYYSKAYDHAIEPYRFDPEEALRLLSEAGWKDHDGDGVLDKEKDGRFIPFAFTFDKSTIRSGYLDALLSAFKEDLRRAGIKMEVRELEWSVLLKQYGDHAYDALVIAYGTDPVFEDPYGSWHSSQAEPGGGNRVGYRNPEADRLLEEVRKTFREEKRYALLRRFHRIIHEDQPCTFLYSWASPVVINRRWRNVKIHKMGVDFYEWWLPRERRKPSDTLPP